MHFLLGFGGTASLAHTVCTLIPLLFHSMDFRFGCFCCCTLINPAMSIFSPLDSYPPTTITVIHFSLYLINTIIYISTASLSWPQKLNAQLLLMAKEGGGVPRSSAIDHTHAYNIHNAPTCVVVDAQLMTPDSCPSDRNSLGTSNSRYALHQLL